MLVSVLGHGLFVNGAHGCVDCGILFVHVPAPYVLIGAAIATLSSWHPVTLGSEIHSEACLNNLTRLLSRF